ncbi:tRNA N(3)-methylcytidine methyltransferase METTL6 isoform X3 [Eucalyptus grandis]|uniref:tRNA N(3)-methylcytidine methyltransferase METTL6 isoform X3 n=1 Tax=Eucalyptus grandis TaxID=71139 RepID=UPI00192EDD21|nr:tRNA N(3)-methylcytidine methyltransferase METTL6 isoform X3 [Eucalyptus grandis]
MSQAEAEYFSKDFDWDDLRNDVESDPSLRHHLLPFPPPAAAPAPPPPPDVAAAWGGFHARHHTGKFFKERRYLLKEFPELVSREKENPRVLEVGCGNGSTVLPILRGNEDVVVYACDCSGEALEYVKEMLDASNVASIERRFYPFLCDFALHGFPMWLACGPCRETSLHQHCCSSGEEKVELPLRGLDMSKDSSCLGGVDFITLIFTLSAIPFQMMPKALAECFCVLKPGGLLLFRDYGLYDMTMLRFESGKRVGFREYMRSDATRSYFFSLEIVRDLFICAGFIELELEYCCIKSLYRRSGKSMCRVWVHGKFQKPE